MSGDESHAWRWGIVAAATLGLAVGGYSWLRHEEPETDTGPVERITLAAYAGDTGALVYVAKEQHFFERHGLEVAIHDYESGKLAAEALMDGEADICTAAGFVLVSSSFDHPELRVLGTVATAEVKELVARNDRRIAVPADLRGKTIGVTRGSGAEWALVTFLTFNRIALDAVELVDLAPSGIVEAIVAGHIDAAFTWDPYVYAIKGALGDNALSWPGGQQFYFVIVTTEEWLDSNPPAAERFMKALLEAEEYVRDNARESKEFVMERFDYNAEYMEYSWPNQEYAVMLEQAMLVTFEEQARWRIQRGLTDATEVPNYLTVLHMRALEKVKPEAVTIIR